MDEEEEERRNKNVITREIFETEVEFSLLAKKKANKKTLIKTAPEKNGKDPQEK